MLSLTKIYKTNSFNVDWTETVEHSRVKSTIGINRIEGSATPILGVGE